MSTQEASTSSPPSSSTPWWTYDVFLNFNGKDTRKHFTDHLYTALKNNSILTFRDDVKLEGGKSIFSELMKAIEESRFAIVIFSINYASSIWCLKELVHIVRCREQTGLEVFPIFYHVKPSDVRSQKGTFAQAFDKHEESFKESIEMVKTWRSSLTEVANLSGWELNDRHESEFIQAIVNIITKKSISKFSRINKNLKGIESVVEELIPSYLDFGKKFCMIGICGMGGMGKTTIARAVYDMFSNHFEVSSFIADVRERSEKGGLRQLQKQLLEECLRGINTKIWDVHQGVDIIKNGLRHKKVLLVLDDVNDLSQLQNLAGEHHWFGLGSWIIITTRDERVLVEHGVLKIYKPNGLKDNDASKLFCLKAFKNEQPKEGYMQLTQEVVKYAGGLPLALVTLGSFLIGRKKDEWQIALDYFIKNPIKKIIDILKISYDGLEESWKEIFLDIACFFNGWSKFEVIHILENCGFNARIGISALLSKSLLTVTGYDEKLGMHDLLQKMGEKIVHQQSCGELGRQSRLWLLEDLLCVLENNMATNAIQAIVIKKRKADFNFEEFPEIFSKMSNLRLLIIEELHIPNALNRVPNGLRHLSWKSCSLKCLPSSFQPRELVELDLRDSKCEYLWEGAKCLGKLKSINLSFSKNLKGTPDFSQVPRLEVLHLAWCTNLVELHPSIGQLSKLKSLNLNSCKSLTNLPSFSEATRLEVLDLKWCINLVGLHPSIGQLSKLKSLNLDSCKSLTNLPSFSEATRLEVLSLEWCVNLVGLHPSIGQLSKLKSLDLFSCRSLTNLPSLSAKMESLTSIDLFDCSKIKKIPEFKGTMKCLSQLILGSIAIEELPPSSIECLTALEILDLEGCKDLKCLPSNMESLRSLKFLYLSGCSKLANLPENLWKIKCLEGLDLSAISQLEEMELNGIGFLSSLKYLSLSCNNFVTLPAIFSQLSKLETLHLCDCEKLRSVPELPSTVRCINMEGCCSLEPLPGLLRQSSLPRPYSSSFFRGYDESSGGVAFTILKRYLQGLFCEKTGYETATKRKEDGSKTEFQIFIPGCLVPRWLTHQSRENSISVVLPSNWCNIRWMGFTLCALFNEEADLSGEYRACVKAIGDMPDSQYVFKNLKFGGWTENHGYLFHNDWLSTVGNSECKQIENHVWLLYLSRDDWFSTVGNAECSKIEVVFKYRDIPSRPVKRCGVSLVYEMEPMEELNQANAQYCSSSRVIAFEGWDGVHHGFVNSKKSRDECDDEFDDH